MLMPCSQCKLMCNFHVSGTVPLSYPTRDTMSRRKEKDLRRNQNTRRRVDGPYVRHRLNPSAHAPTMRPMRSRAVQAAATAPVAMAMDATFKSAVAVSDVA